MRLIFENPPGSHPPLGLCSHTAVVPEGTVLLFFSGQLGIRPDGSTPATRRRRCGQTELSRVTQGITP